MSNLIRSGLKSKDASIIIIFPLSVTNANLSPANASFIDGPLLLVALVGISFSFP